MRNNIFKKTCLDYLLKLFADALRIAAKNLGEKAPQADALFQVQRAGFELVDELVRVFHLFARPLAAAKVGIHSKKDRGVGHDHRMDLKCCLVVSCV